jgi:hypothetical protein
VLSDRGYGGDVETRQTADATHDEVRQAQDVPAAAQAQREEAKQFRGDQTIRTVSEF